MKEKSVTGRTLSFVVNKLWLLIAMLVILTALVFTLLRIFLPQINIFKDEVETWVEQKYGIELEVESIGGEWRASGPVFSLKNLNVKSNDGQLSLISVENLSIYFDGLGSLLENTFVTESIEVSGASLDFIIDRKLGVRIDSLEESSELPNTQFQETSQLFLKTLFSQKRLQIKQSNITLETLSGREFQYQIDNLALNNFDQIHQLTGNLRDAHGGDIQLVAEIHGDPSEKSSFTHLYLQGKGIQIGELPILVDSPRLKPDEGLLSWRLWADWKDKRWQDAIGDIALENVSWDEVVELNAKEELDQGIKKLAKLEKFNSRFSWNSENSENGFLTLYDVQIIQNNSPFTISPQAYLVYQQNETLLEWDLIFQDIQAKTFTPYLDLLLGDAIENISFTESDLRLLINEIGLRFARKNAKWLSPSINIDFEKLTYKRLADFPVVNGLNGNLTYSDGVGAAKLEGESVSFDFKGFFRNELFADKFFLDFKWKENEAEKIDLQINSASFENKDLSLKAKSRFHYLGSEPVLSIYAEVSDIDASQKSKYLPVAVMEPELVEYLDNSVKTGRLPLTKAVVHGPLSAFPFEKQEGLFSILGMLEESKFKFQPDWPAVENLNAKLLFEGNGMDLRALAGNANGNRVNSARAVIKDFSANNTPFELDINAQVFDNNGTKYLEQTPINHISQVLSAFDLKGSTNLKLGMKFGLEDSSNLSLNGVVTPSKEDAEIRISEVKLNNIEGSVLFNERGLLPSEIVSQYHNNKIITKLEERTAGENNSEIIADIKGQLSKEVLGDFVGKEWTSIINGKSPFTAKLVASGADESPVKLRISSSLKGMSFKLPGEFLKDASQLKPVEIDLALTEERQVLEILWDKLEGQIVWDDKNENPSGAFYYGVADSLPTKLSNEFLLKGKLSGTRLSDWQETIELVYPEIFAKDSNVESKGLGVSERDNSQPHSGIKLTANLEFGELITPIATFDKTDLAIHKTANDRWLLGIHNKSVNALVRISPGNPIEIEANDLNLKLHDSLFENDEKKADDHEADFEKEGSNKKLKKDLIKEEAESWQLLAFWPDIDLECQDCRVEEKILGDVKLNLRNYGDYLQITGLSNRKDAHNLFLDAKWYQKEVNVESDLKSKKDTSNPIEKNLINRTQLNYVINSPNVGRLMSHWNYPVGIEESRGGSSGRIWWENSPWNFNAKEIEGDASFRFGKGYLSEVSDAKARLFSLFNLQSLSRKLSLDFKDVYKKGFFYEKLYGDVSLRDGIVTTDNVFVDGNAAKVTLSGSVNLKEETIEQYAFVVPQLTSSLPVLVGWAVEPTTGLLVYLVNKIMEPAIEVVTQIEYRIHGPLDKITVDEIKKVKSKVKYDVPQDVEENKEDTGTAEEKSEESVKNESQDKDKDKDKGNDSNGK